MDIIIVGSIALTILALTTLLVFVGNRMSKNLSGNKKVVGHCSRYICHYVLCWIIRRTCDGRFYDSFQF